MTIATERLDELEHHAAMIRSFGGTKQLLAIDEVLELARIYREFHRMARNIVDMTAEPGKPGPATG